MHCKLQFFFVVDFRVKLPFTSFEVAQNPRSPLKDFKHFKKCILILKYFILPVHVS